MAPPNLVASRQQSSCPGPHERPNGDQLLLVATKERRHHVLASANGNEFGILARLGSSIVQRVEQPVDLRQVQDPSLNVVRVFDAGLFMGQQGRIGDDGR